MDDGTRARLGSIEIESPKLGVETQKFITDVHNSIKNGIWIDDPLFESKYKIYTKYLQDLRKMKKHAEYMLKGMDDMGVNLLQTSELCLKYDKVREGFSYRKAAKEVDALGRDFVLPAIISHLDSAERLNESFRDGLNAMKLLNNAIKTVGKEMNGEYDVS